ncbi:MAG: hypothetical protein M1391_08700 [Bacteroidetes bacterium]|nr:hypothetical protein [Bacteroidota bacterium]
MKKSFVAVAVIITLFSTWLLAAGGDQIPKGWFKAGMHPKEYEIKIDKGTTKDGNPSLLIESLNPKDEKDIGNLMQVISADNYLGKRLKLSGEIKTEKVDAAACLWMRVDGEKIGPNNPSLSFDNMFTRAPKGTTDWKKYEIVLDVPANAKTINFGLMLIKTGKAWFSNLKIEEVGTDVPVTGAADMMKHLAKQPVNLNFEE